MSLTLFLAACSNKPITSHSTGIWDHYIIYNCSQFIIGCQSTLADMEWGSLSLRSSSGSSYCH